MGASWPWNLSTVPTRASCGRRRLIAPTWALKGATMRTSSATNGEIANPQFGTFVPVSDAGWRDHATAPLSASSAFKIPVAPKV